MLIIICGYLSFIDEVTVRDLMAWLVQLEGVINSQHVLLCTHLTCLQFS